MNTIYVDMDGVLVEFDPSKSIEEVATPGYSRNLKPMQDMCNAIRALSVTEGLQVRILSAVISGAAAIDKKIWLNKFLGKNFADNAIFVPYGIPKSRLVEPGYLIDDFSKNLHEWRGIGIKVYNGINGHNGTWRGYSVHAHSSWENIYNQLLGIIMVNEMMNDAI